MQRSSRDLGDLRDRMRAWIAGKVPEGKNHDVVISGGATSTGYSSETILMDVSWDQGGERRTEPMVARLAPSPSDVPVFPSYDLRKQFETMRLVERLTEVPVPKMRWIEDDPGAIGAPFFVMDRIEGVVPPDVMPYTFGDNWLFDSGADDRRRLQESSVAVLTQLHAIERPEEIFSFLSFDESGESALDRHVAHTRAWYEFAVAGGTRSNLVERAFGWLDEHWPSQVSETVLSWGDSRIGNVMYRDYLPVAVLDWEMAGLGPRELDVTWMIFAHCVFQDLAGSLGAPGMPDFLRADDVISSYEKVTGSQVRDLAFYGTYAAIQWGIVFLRTGMRQVHFGEIPMPDDPDELMHHRASLEKMADGRYWD
jgi:aminoglycoside phosphotransferase (APT) family kinase protein